MSQANSRIRNLIDSTAAVAMIVAAIFLTSAVRRAQVSATNRRVVDVPAPTPVPGQPISVAGAPAIGSRSAPVVLLEFADFQCPYCGKAAREILPDVVKKYVRTGQLRFVFRHLPLVSHRYAEKAAEAAECAGNAGLFWPMHDALFSNQNSLDIESLERQAVQLGLPKAAFAKCLGEGSTAGKVRADAVEAGALQIHGTPTFMIGTAFGDGRVKVSRVLVGVISSQVIGDALAALTSDHAAVGSD